MAERNYDKFSGKPRRFRGSTPLTTLVRRLTQPLFGKRGLADGRVVSEWTEIVGPMLARSSVPQRIVYPRGERTGGTLHLKVAPGGMATELQHLEPLLIERINTHFGYRAVTRLALIQGPLPAPPPAPAPPPELDAEAERHLDQLLKDVTDPSVRERLNSLGRAVLARPAVDNSGLNSPKKA
ncbi:MAG: DciA family protein [Pseudomonadota bacterium]